MRTSAVALAILALVPLVASRPRALYQATAPNASSPSSFCVAPRTFADELRGPFCVVPALVSQPAQAYLRVTHPQAPLAIQSAQQVAAQRAAVKALSNSLASPILPAYLKERRNITLGGVASVIAHPVNASSNDTAIFWLHGGGFYFGSCYTGQIIVVAGIAKAAGMNIVCPEYRLIPEHPFPAGLDDSVAAYQALLQQYSPNKIALVGDSAGGNLAMALLQRLRQQGLPMPGAVGLLSPSADLTFKGDSVNTLVGVDPILATDYIPGSVALTYVSNDTSKLNDPLVSPLFANYTPAAIGKLPPVLIQVGLREVLLSDSVNLYRALVRAGQRATISPWEGMWHDFQTQQFLPEAQEASNEMAAFFKNTMR